MHANISYNTFVHGEYDAVGIKDRTCVNQTKIRSLKHRYQVSDNLIPIIIIPTNNDPINCY